MLFFNTLISMNLLLIMIASCNPQALLPQGCICYNPRVFNVTDNSTVPCDDPQCSRGDNLDCVNDDEGYSNIFDNRAFGFYIPYDNDVHKYYFVTLGCNCPGFNYNHGASGNNGFSNTPANGASYTYNNCSDFSLNIDDAAYCCNYCCGSSSISTTASTLSTNISTTSTASPISVPAAASSTSCFYSLLLDTLVFLCLRVYQND
jgi:hypothetical protein